MFKKKKIEKVLRTVYCDTLETAFEVVMGINTKKGDYSNTANDYDFYGPKKPGDWYRIDYFVYDYR